jgi:hypothetical protein
LEVRDFQATGVVAFARGTPFYQIRPGKLEVQDRRIAVDKSQIDARVEEIQKVAQALL